MNKIACRLAMFIVSACCVGRALAGIADTPLPVLSVGATTYHLYSVPSIIPGSAGLATYFGCTSTDTATMQVTVELFGGPGGAPANDAVADSLSLGPGANVVFGTRSAVGISVSKVLGFGVGGQGSARILATSKNLICTAYLADQLNAPPTSQEGRDPGQPEGRLHGPRGNQMSRPAASPTRADLLLRLCALCAFVVKG